LWRRRGIWRKVGTFRGGNLERKLGSWKKRTPRLGRDLKDE
jgi:hypothetical protein